MSAEQRFDLDAEGPGPERGDSPTSPGTPEGKEEARRPTPRRGAALRRTAGRRPAAPAAGTAASVPFVFAPWFLLLLGALILAVLWASGLFSSPGAHGTWPWELFQAGGDDGGGFTFQWAADEVRTILGAFFVLFFLVAAFVPASRGRGGAVLVVAALGMVTLPPHAATPLYYVAAALLGMGAGALLAHEGLRGGKGGRGLLLAMLVLLGAALFFPLGPSTGTWHSLAVDLFRDLFGGASGRGFTDVLLEPSSAIVLMALVQFLVILFAWLGAGGKWVLWVGGLALLVGAIAPPVLYLRDYLAATDGFELQEALRAMALGILPVAFLAFVLPTAAGVADATRPAR